jgi:UDP-N-acetylglucosamine--N-acetylmuramyl-(pentapeptide) pyrophosphoryl-undecaprenol N-acetylglucosamine transferase
MGLKVIVAAGGTGGHLFPAMALMREVESVCPNAEITFVGREEGIERSAIEGSSWGYLPLEVEGLHPRAAFRNTKALYKAFQAALRCRGTLRRSRPNVAIGFGSFVSAPLLLAARSLGIPTAIHEQNAIPGRVNRWLARGVDRIYTAYEGDSVSRAFRAAQPVGIPVRREVVGCEPRFEEFGLDPGPLTVLVFGGSQGARSLCFSALEAIRILQDRGLEFQTILQTGTRNYQEARAIGVPAATAVFPFIENMGAAYACADVVVARAGAGSIAEIAANACPAILVPYPHAADDHQRKNAEPLVRAGAAQMIEDVVLNGSTLAHKLEGLLKDRQLRDQMSEKILQFSRPDAGSRMAAGIVELGDAGNGKKGGDGR